MKELLSLLNTIHPLSPALVKYLTEKLKVKVLTKKTFLLEAGHISRHIYFIKKGLFRCYYIQNDEEVCAKFLKEGDIVVSANSFFLQKDSTEYIQAIEDSTVWYICYEELQYLYTNFPEFNNIARQLSIKSYLLSEQRISFIRMKLAAERYTAMLSNFPELILRVPAKYMASYLSITEETLSRIRSRRL
jgi:CRP/FNR family transcriptional regulator, anaerobic regulatory protein